MKNIFYFLLILLSLVLLVLFFSQEYLSEGLINLSSSQMALRKKSIKPAEKKIRQPAVAGQFYPAGQRELSEQVERLLAQAETQPLSGSVKGLIVPHAGYVFSGPVAAHAYQAIKGQPIKRVILIGPGHHFYLDQPVIDGHDFWQTPLGQVKLDDQLRQALVKESSLFKIDSAPHQPEHSLEVQLPFLQKTLGQFTFLPILVNQLRPAELEELSRVLAQHLDKETIIMASSDLSHYPSYQAAQKADQEVIKAILTGQSARLKQVVEEAKKQGIKNLVTSLCGQAAVEILMATMKQAGIGQRELLKYANSGDSSWASQDQVVGYAAIAFITESLAQPPALDQYSLPNLTKEQEKKLLEIAQQSVEDYYFQGQIPRFSITDPLLNQSAGLFVTIKNNGQLRGCLGQLLAQGPLYQTAAQMAVAAAYHDQRFRPVQPDEFDSLEYEISLLSQPKKISHWSEIELGQDGVLVKQGQRQQAGFFLPQVALENNWSLEEFMNTLCQEKAGLAAEAWKNGQAEIYTFKVKVIK